MKTKQALITCGGTGSRLRKAGMEFPVSKSFIEFEGRPMFYWCLLGLYHAGIEKLVIIGDGAEKLREAEQVLSNFPYDFSQVDWHEDTGLGTSGLPYQARHLLEDNFFFEFGHSVSEPEHYHRLEDELKVADSIVLSKFKPNSYAPRPYFRVNDEKIIPLQKLTGDTNEFSVGPPYLLNQRYVHRLPKLGFDIYRITESYCYDGLIELVQSNLPIEVDVIDEWNEAVPIYQSYIKKLCARA